MKRLRDDVEKTKKQITKAKVLADKFGGKENAETYENSAPPNSNGELIAENAKGPSINDVTLIFGVLDPPPPLSAFSAKS